MPPDQVRLYRDALGERGRSLVFGVTSEAEVVDVLARIDSLI